MKSLQRARIGFAAFPRAKWYKYKMQTKKLSLHDQNEGENPLMESYSYQFLRGFMKGCVYSLKWLYTKHTTFWLLTTPCLLGNNPIFNTSQLLSNSWHSKNVMII